MVIREKFILDFASGSVVKNPPASARDLESHGQRSLVGYIVHGITKESDTT